MRTNRLAAFVVLGVALILTGCAQKAPLVPPSYTVPGRLAFDVAQIAVVDNNVVRPAESYGYLDANYEPRLAQAVKQWASERFQAVGQSGQLTVVIKSARFVRVNEPYSGGASTLFHKEHDERRIATIELQINAMKPEDRNFQGHAAVKAMYSTTLMKDADDAERNAAWTRVFQGVMSNLDQETQNAVQKYLSQLVVAAPAVDTSLGGMTPVAAPPMPVQAVPAEAPVIVAPPDSVAAPMALTPDALAH